MTMRNLQHFIFTPKYRLPIFSRPEVAAEAERLLRHIAALKKITVIAISVMPDHVHVFCELHYTLSNARAAYHLKWFSSCWLQKRFADLRKTTEKTPKGNALWGEHYFYRSVGGDEKFVQKYIQEQSHT